MNLILLAPEEVSATGDVRLSGHRAAHLRSVLKVARGQRVRVGIVDGALGEGVVEKTGDDTIDLRCSFEPSAPMRPPVDVLLAMPRPKVLQRLWAPLAAMGVGQIMLTNAERVERCYFDTHVLTEASYRPLLIEGLQQARDTRLPAVSIHRRFKVLVEDDLNGLSGTSLRLVADPGAKQPVGVVVRKHDAAHVLLAIGPEGGWNAFELGLLEAHGFQQVGTGARTLRSDTACIALLALVHDAIAHPPSRAALRRDPP